MPRATAVTLLTDFGTHDPYVAAMKGVILSIAPYVHVVDIAHDIAQGDVLSAAYILWQSTPYFPPNSVHIALVDPGSGSTEGQIMAARIGGHTYVFPDNGIITLLAETNHMEAMVAVQNSDFLPSTASRTFHGRDIFAPVAAYLAGGGEMSRLGPQPSTYKSLDIPAPRFDHETLIGEVVYVDKFGNAITDLTYHRIVQHLGGDVALKITCSGHEIGPLRDVYGMVEQGTPLALINSAGLLEIACNRASAAAILHLCVGSDVTVTFADKALPHGG